MARKLYTIFVLPHATERLRKIHFSRGFVVTVSLILGFAVVVTAAAPHLVLKLRAQAEVLSALEAENRKLLEEKRHFEASLAELGSVIGTIESRARTFAKAIGSERLPVGDASGGRSDAAPAERGDSFQDMLNEEMEALRLRSRNLDVSFDHLDEALRARERFLASTPTGLPVEGFLSEGYGWRSDPISGERQFHRGLDIVAPPGSPIRAPADGVITGAGRTAGYGKTVQVSHGYGYSTRYAHLSEIAVRAGQRVRRGDLIGKVGSTGRSTGPHLHYEIYKAGRAVNPNRYVARRPS